MYTTCLFCSRPLGSNQVIEHFPVGRRLAFDAEKGRLWVVCRECQRWNLTPLEERWEAIEEAERLYRGTRLRMATEHIGLAMLPEGLELVRIGAPRRAGASCLPVDWRLLAASRSALERSPHGSLPLSRQSSHGEATRCAP